MSDGPSEVRRSLADAELRRLRRAYPRWRVWYVLTWDGTRRGVVWCARHRRDGRLLAGDTPGHLAEYIAEADIPAS